MVFMIHVVIKNCLSIIYKAYLKAVRKSVKLDSLSCLSDYIGLSQLQLLK